MNFINTTDTFNGKPQWRNVIAVILGTIGALVLFVSWTYHMLVQVITMPRDQWITLANDAHYPIHKEYPNIFCNYLCKAEALMIYQLELLRAGFGREYCDEDSHDD